LNNLFDNQNYVNEINRRFQLLDLFDLNIQNQYKEVFVKFSDYFGTYLLKNVLKINKTDYELMVNLSFQHSFNEILKIIQDLKNEINALQNNDAYYLLSKLNNYLSNTVINKSTFRHFTLTEIEQVSNRDNIIESIYKGIFKGSTVRKINLRYAQMDNLEFLKLCYYCINLTKINTFNLI
jgi:hypothetical protein